MKPKLDYNGSKNHLPKIAKNEIKTTQKNFHPFVDMQCLRLARSFCSWMKPKLDYNGSENHLLKIAKNGIETTQKNFHAFVDMQCLRLAWSFCRWMTYYFLLKKESQTTQLIVVADFGCCTILFSTFLTTMGLKEGC